MSNNNTTVINLSGSIESNIHGYGNLASVYNQILSSKNTDVYIDLSRLKWIDANLAAVLGAIMSKGEEMGYRILLQNIPFKTSNVFLRNGFINRSSIYTASLASDTIVRYWEFPASNGQYFIEYLANEIIAKDCFPADIPNFKKEVSRNISEIFENAALHSGSKYIYTCGQHYPQKSPARLDLSIVCLGHTFSRNVNLHLKSLNQPQLDAHDAIEWATKYQNTTKTVPGGIGLSMLINFINLNRGKIQIVSGDGFWEYNTNGVDVYNREIKNFFPGTIVTVEFNVDKNNHSNYLLINNTTLTTKNNIF